MNTNTNALPNTKKRSRGENSTEILYKISFREMEKMKHMIRHHPVLGVPGWMVDETFARWDRENAAKPERSKK